MAHSSTTFKRREQHPNWNSGTMTHRLGYTSINVKKYHPRATEINGSYYVRRSILMAEKVLGKPLPLNAVIHHVDEDTTNDSNDNFVICEDRGYHATLHKRIRALEACGHADWRKCWICKEYDSPENLYIKGHNIYHRKCRTIKIKRRKKVDG